MVMAHEVRMVTAQKAQRVREVRMVTVLEIWKAHRTHPIQQDSVIHRVHQIPKALRVHHMLMARAEMAIVIIMVRDQPMHQVLLHQGHQQILHLLIQRPVRILRLHRGLAVKVIKIIEVMGDKRDKVKRAVGAMVDKTT